MAQQVGTRDGAQPTVQVLEKALAIIDWLAAEPDMGAARLAEAMEEPRSTVYRLLASLEKAGFVEPGPTRGSYRLGLRLLYLGNVVARGLDTREWARPVLERIHDAFGETVYLSIRRDDESVCIEQLEGRRVRSLVLQLGTALPLHAGAAPRVLLAFADEQSQEAYLARESFAAYTDKTPVTPAAIRQELQQIRERGYAVSDEDVGVGFAALGVPIFDHRGEVTAALSVSGVVPAILGEQQPELVRMLLEGAAEISAALGYEHDGHRP